MVGGSAHTVAMGGYFQGGGHSPLSPKLGLGVDQIISFTMVTVDGDIIDVTKTGKNLYLCFTPAALLPSNDHQ